MNYTALRAALQPAGGTTTIAANTLTPNVATLLQAVNAGQPLVITGAQPGPGDDQNDTIVLTGSSGLLGVMNLPVTLQATVDAGGNAQLVLRYTLLGPSPGPNDWRFSQSFPSLPQVPNWDQPIDEPTSSLLDGLPLSNASYVVVTQPQADAGTGVPLAPGINFVGQLRPTGVVAFIESIFGKSDTLTLYGTIVVPAPTAVFTPLGPAQLPWTLPSPPPGISLQASLGLDYAMGKLEFQGVGFRVYTPASADWLQANPTYQPAMAYVGTLSVPSANVSGSVVAPVELGADALLLLVSFTGVSIANLALLVDAVGTNNLTGAMPDSLTSQGPLGDLQLTNLGLELSASPTGYGLTWASVTVGMPDLNWKIWADHFVLDTILTRFDVTTPFTAPEVDVTVFGRIEIESIPFDVFATSADGFVVYAQLEPGQRIPLSSLLATYAPQIAPPGDLGIDALQVSVAPFKSYSMALAMAEQPNPWVIPIGPSSLTVSDLVCAFAYPTGGPASGSFGGTIAFDSVASLSISYAVPGPFILRGTFPEVKLSTLLGALTNQSVGLPSGFDLDFVNSSVLIEQQNTMYLFQLGTQVEGIGSFALQVQKVGGQWGFAAGMDLSGGKASGLPGLSAVAGFESMFNLDKLLLVVSSFDAPAFTFPDLAAFSNPQISAKSISLPASSGGIIAGLSIYAQWSLDQSKEQQLLKSLLGLSPVLGVTLQIGEDPAANAKLFVSFSTQIKGLPFSCQFGGMIQNGEIGLFLTGSLQVKIQGQVQEFDVTLVFVENGAFISGTMKGPTAIDFGSFKLSNLALEIGTDWEGIPSVGVAGTVDTSRFEASVAVFFDSADPAKSLVAGSVSSLTLADVLDTFAGDVVPSAIDDVLSQVAVKGTGAFTIPGTVAADLDALNIGAVSAAFAAQHVTIPASISQVLLNDPDFHPSQDDSVKPAGTRWYLTDMVTMRHYELAKQGQDIQVMLSPQFYCAPQATYIGTIAFPQGFYINAAIDIFGFTASVTANISTSSGIAVDAAMDPIVIGSPNLFGITGYDGKGGPVLSMATYTQPTQPKPEFRPPHFFASGDFQFLGLAQDEFYIDITENGFVFDLVGNLLPLVTFDIHGHFLGLDNFGAGGGITIGFVNETIDLGLSSGPLTLDTYAKATLDVNYDGNDITAKLDFAFDFQGQTLEVAAFELDVETGPLSNLWQTVKDKIIDRLLHADITLHIDNMVQQHLDQAGSTPINVPGQHTDTPAQHHDQSGAPHYDVKDWQGKHQDTPQQHIDSGTQHLDSTTAHTDVPGTSHLDSASQHQDQYYHTDQGVETTTKPPAGQQQ